MEVTGKGLMTRSQLPGPGGASMLSTLQVTATVPPALLSVSDGKLQLHSSYSCRCLSLQDCVYCESEGKGNICLPYEEDSPSLGLGDASEAKEEESPRKEVQT